MRRKDPKALLSELDREQIQLARDRIAVKLGKFSKIHELSDRKERIARMLTVLGEKVRATVPTTNEADMQVKKASSSRKVRKV